MKLSQKVGAHYIGRGAPTPSTDLPTAYENRIYYDEESGISWRLKDNSVGANVWVSLEIPAKVISPDTEPTFTDVPEGSIWNDGEYIFKNGKWKKLKSDTAPTPDDDVTEGYDVGDKWDVNGDTYICEDNKDGNAIWPKVVLSKPTTSDNCSDLTDTGYVKDGATTYKCLADGVWLNTNDMTVDIDHEPTSSDNIPPNVKIYEESGDRQWHTDEEGNILADVSDRVPTAGDDADDGYKPGDIWTVTPSGDKYINKSNTVGSAQWAKIIDRNPTKTDDVDEGWAAGDWWYNGATGTYWNCLDNSDDNAVWTSKEIVNDIELDRDPTVDDDADDGINVGDTWKNTDTEEEFVCKDNTPGEAVWTKTRSNTRPTEDDDVDRNFEPGDELKVGDATFICTDNTDGAAVWVAKFYRDPTPDDDENSTPNWDVGDTWLNAATGSSFVCLDNTDGAAVWNSSSQKNNVETDRDPTVDDDEDKFFKLDDTWKNTDTGEEFLCRDNTDGDAKWIKTKSNTVPDDTFNTDAGYKKNDEIEVGSDTYRCINPADPAKWAKVEARNPNKDDDTTEGFEVGDLWVNDGTGEVFTCQDDTDGAAIWTGKDTKTEVETARDPETTDNTDKGFKKDDTWVNTDTGDEFICSDPVNGIWVKTLAHSAPTEDDDKDHGYYGGYIWKTPTATWKCLDASSGAAIWARYEDRDPTADDDVNAEYPSDVDDIWINSNTDTKFKCTDNTDGAAVWEKQGIDKEDIAFYLGQKSSFPTSRNTGTALKNGDHYYDTNINTMVKYDEDLGLWVIDGLKNDGTYVGAQDVEPGERSDGSNLQEGDKYYNTDEKVWYEYSGSEWKKVTDSSSPVSLNLSDSINCDDYIYGDDYYGWIDKSTGEVGDNRTPPKPYCVKPSSIFYSIYYKTGFSYKRILYYDETSKSFKNELANEEYDIDSIYPAVNGDKNLPISIYYDTGSRARSDSGKLKIEYDGVVVKEISNGRESYSTGYVDFDDTFDVKKLVIYRQQTDDNSSSGRSMELKFLNNKQ